MSLAPITVKFELRKEPGVKEIYISPQSEVVIAKDIPGTRHVYRYKEVGEYLSAFRNIELYRDNVHKDTADIRLKDYWIYFDNNLHSAEYTLILHEEGL